MFYSQYILARKGPLGKIWLAAHFEKKLTKSQVFATDITESVNSIVNPTVPLALRVSGHLMLGIVRIYSDKVRYLSSDCRDAMTRINLAFKGQTNRVDIEEAAGGKIDDANYALLPMDEDDQSAQIAFRRKVVRSIPKLDESDVTSFFAVGEIELLRHDLSRPSIQSRRSTATLDISRRSLDQKLEDDVLPAFDAHIGDSLYNTSNFELFEPFEVLKESEAIQKERQQSLEFFPPVTPDAGEQFDFAPVQSTTIKAKTSKAKRRKVEINEQVEIPDKQWKQRLIDVNAIVREPRTLLGGEPHTGFRENFEDITGSLHYCPELSNLIDVFSDHRAESFAFLQHLQKNIEIIPENILEPELARRQSGLEVSADAESLREAVGSRRSIGNVPTRQERRESFASDFAHDQYSQYDYGIEDNAPMLDKSFGRVSAVVEKSLLPLDNAPLGDISDEQKSERTKAVYSIVEQELVQKGEESLQSFCSGCSKAVAARFFLELLQLKTWGKVELIQAQAFDPIMVRVVASS